MTQEQGESPEFTEAQKKAARKNQAAKIHKSAHFVHCSACGRSVSAKDSFCGNCGARFQVGKKAPKTDED